MKRRNFLSGLTSGAAVFGTAVSTGFPNRAEACGSCGETSPLVHAVRTSVALIIAVFLIWFYQVARTLIFGPLSSLIGVMVLMVSRWLKMGIDLRALGAIVMITIIISRTWPRNIQNQVKAVNRSASKVSRAVDKTVGTSKNLDRQAKEVKSLQTKWKEKSREFKSAEKTARKAASGKKLSAADTKKLNTKKARANADLQKMKSKLDAAKAAVEKANSDLKAAKANIASLKSRLKKGAKERQTLNNAFKKDANKVSSSHQLMYSRQAVALLDLDKMVFNQLTDTTARLKSADKNLKNGMSNADRVIAGLSVKFKF
ncbi:MAG: twin-arginine translocation signal domain-containing protein [Rhodobacteraceae bacterium]|nr:twin-arginine translocation signal domain-containing protein [Paracoccaceae bacterium]